MAETIATGCSNDVVCIYGEEWPEKKSKGTNKIGTWCHKERDCGFLIWDRKAKT